MHKDDNFIHESGYPQIFDPPDTAMEGRSHSRISWGGYPIIFGAGTGTSFAAYMWGPHVSETPLNKDVVLKTCNKNQFPYILWCACVRFNIF
jgi:hypothetical protein